MDDAVGAMAVFVVRTATRVPCLALLCLILFRSAALVLVVMGVMTDMVHCSRTLFVQTICRCSGSPLQRHEQHEKKDHEFTHGLIVAYFDSVIALPIQSLRDQPFSTSGPNRFHNVCHVEHDRMS